MKLERSFSVDRDETVLRPLLLTGMKKLGFKLINSDTGATFRFKRGSRLAAFPNYLTYAEVEFAQDSGKMRAAVSVPLVPRWAVLPRMRDIWECLIDAIGLIVRGDDSSQSIDTFLDLTKRATTNNLLLLGVPLFFVLYSFLSAAPELLTIGISLYGMQYVSPILRIAVLILIGAFFSLVILIVGMVVLGVYYYCELKTPKA